MRSPDIQFTSSHSRLTTVYNLNMKPFAQLTVGEIKAMSDEQIEQYAEAVGTEQLDKADVRKLIAVELGRRTIRKHIAALKKLEKDMEG